MDPLSNDDPAEKRSAIPYQFLREQLENVLPLSYRNATSMAEISIEASFTVSENGRISDIEFTNSNAPVKLNRLMRKVLRKSRFRPALVAGRPVSEQNVTLTQSFISN